MGGFPPHSMAVLHFDPNRTLVIAGPTSAGKSALATRLAASLPLEFVCMDSMQLYRELTIGTGKPTGAEITAVPHHLFGTVSVTEAMTAFRYTELARRVLGQIQARGNIPCLVGGTGLYMRTLFEGADPLPPTPADLRRRLRRISRERGKEQLYRLLCRLDPAGAARLHPNDTQRIQRFLEIRIMTGHGILEWWKGPLRLLPARIPVTVGLEVERSLLKTRIAARVRSMLKEGWIEETQDLIDSGLMEHVALRGPIGYRQIGHFLRGDYGLETLTSRIIITTGRYAKRQMTWFQKVSYIQWFPFLPKSGYNISDILAFVNSKLG